MGKVSIIVLAAMGRLTVTCDLATFLDLDLGAIHAGILDWCLAFVYFEETSGSFICCSFI